MGAVFAIIRFPQAEDSASQILMLYGTEALSLDCVRSEEGYDPSVNVMQHESHECSIGYPSRLEVEPSKRQAHLLDLLRAVEEMQNHGR